MRLKQSFTGLKSFSTDLDGSSVGQLVVLHQERCLVCKFLFSVNVVCYVANLLFHDSDCFKICALVECMTSQCEQLYQISCNISTCNVQSPGLMSQGISIINGTNVSH